jgi:hypothetical protein
VAVGWKSNAMYHLPIHSVTVFLILFLLCTETSADGKFIKTSTYFLYVLSYDEADFLV